MSKYSKVPDGWFVVRRTGSFHSSDQPCEGATVCQLRCVDRRTATSPAQLPGGEKDWFSHGENHRTDEDGEICRDIYHAGWIFQGDVLEFVRQHGCCVVFWNPDFECFDVEIYDTCRE